MTTAGDLILRLSPADGPGTEADAVLARLRYDIQRAGISARFATAPAPDGTKAASDVVPVLLVAVALLAEARKVVQILSDARTRRGQTIAVTVDKDKQSIRVTNARPEDLDKIIEGHYRSLGPGPDGSA